jgi:RIO kinase 1
MLSADLIHGDLSEFNILLGADGPVIIDFPQVVAAARNSRSEQFFRRDLGNLVRFFSNLDPALKKHEGDANEIWRAYTTRNLHPEFVPSGRPPPKEFAPRGGPPPWKKSGERGEPRPPGRGPPGGGRGPPGPLRQPKSPPAPRGPHVSFKGQAPANQPHEASAHRRGDQPGRHPREAAQGSREGGPPATRDAAARHPAGGRPKEPQGPREGGPPQNRDAAARHPAGGRPKEPPAPRENRPARPDAGRSRDDRRRRPRRW